MYSSIDTRVRRQNRTSRVHRLDKILLNHVQSSKQHVNGSVEICRGVSVLLSPDPDDLQFLPPGRLAAGADSLGPPLGPKVSDAPLDLIGPVLCAQQDIRAPPGRQDVSQPVDEPVRRLHAVPAAGVRERQQVRVVVKGMRRPVRVRVRRDGPPRQRLCGHVRRVEDEHVDTAGTQRRCQVALDGIEEGAARLVVFRPRPPRRGPRCRAGVPIHVDGRRQHAPRAKDGVGMGVDEADDHARARSNLHHQRGRGWLWLRRGSFFRSAASEPGSEERRLRGRG